MKNSTIFMLAGALCLFACSEDGPEADPCQANAPSITAVNETATACGQASGTLVVIASGGTAPLQYSINGGNFVTSNSFNNLAAGNYTLSVRDANGCTAAAEKAVTEGSTLQLSAQVNAPAGCGTAHGELTMSATGGSGVFTFSIDGTTFQADPHFTNLVAGNYTLTAKDAANCTTTTSARVLNGTSYENQVKSIIQTNCAVSGCHASGTPQPNFTNLATVQANAANIKTRTQNGSMPPPGSGKTLTQAQIQAIACWVDDGALSN